MFSPIPAAGGGSGGGSYTPVPSQTINLSGGSASITNGIDHLVLTGVASGGLTLAVPGDGFYFIDATAASATGGATVSLSATNGNVAIPLGIESIWHVAAGTAKRYNALTTARALAHATGNTTVSSPGTNIALDTLDYQDVSGMWTTGDNTKLVVPAGFTKARVTAGIYQAFTGNLYINWWSAVLKNGAGITPQVAVTGYYTGEQCNPIIPVVAGDYFQLNCACQAANPVYNGTWMQLECFP